MKFNIAAWLVVLISGVFAGYRHGWNDVAACIFVGECVACIGWWVAYGGCKLIAKAWDYRGTGQIPILTLLACTLAGCSFFDLGRHTAVKPNTGDIVLTNCPANHKSSK